MQERKPYTTTKIKRETLRLLRSLAAHDGRSMIDTVHRLVVEELKRRGLTGWLMPGREE